MNKLPKAIRVLLGEEYIIDNIGCSGAQIYIFKDKVLKIEKTNPEANKEYLMLKWLKGKFPVPDVLKFMQVDGYNYLLMTRLVGAMAASDTYLNNPEILVHLLAKAVIELWKVDTTNIPIGNTLATRLEDARLRIEQNLVDFTDIETDTLSKFSSPKALYDYLINNKVDDDLVFSHGDFCLPNIFFKGDKLTGVIDLGRSGIYNRYNDIALCYRSLNHNLNQDYANKFLEVLNMPIDFKKIEYFILLDELF